MNKLTPTNPVDPHPHLRQGKYSRVVISEPGETNFTAPPAVDPYPQADEAAQLPSLACCGPRLAGDKHRIQ